MQYFIKYLRNHNFYSQISFSVTDTSPSTIQQTAAPFAETEQTTVPAAVTELTSGVTSTSTSMTSTLTTPCVEMEAMTNPFVLQYIEVSPTDIVNKQDFSPDYTQNNGGVDFPSNDLHPIITVSFQTPAERVTKVELPQRTLESNTERFSVIFYNAQNQPINQNPILSTVGNSLTAPKVDSSQIPQTDSISKVEITVVATTNSASPKNLAISITACIEQGMNVHFF